MTKDWPRLEEELFCFQVQVAYLKYKAIFHFTSLHNCLGCQSGIMSELHAQCLIMMNDNLFCTDMWIIRILIK